MMMYMGDYHGLGMLIALAIVIVPIWKICQKAGYSGWWSLLAPLPLINIVFLYILAFSDWPSSRPQLPGGES